MKIIAKTLEGLEQVLASELESLGVQDIQILKRAVTYSGDLTVLYKSNLLLRTCLRVLVFVKEFEIKDESDLYTEVKGMKWEDYIDLDDTFAIDSIVNSDKFRHANYIALKAKDAIADRFRDKYGKRPSVDVKNPDLKINVHIRQNIVTISLDSSGSSLHIDVYKRQGFNPIILFPHHGSGKLKISALDIRITIPPKINIIPALHLFTLSS